MKYWEFLIQKEGDETWLPLETHQVEILEGRYRVVAHTDRINTPVDIRVSQLITTETPPRRRVRDHTGQINGAGLAVVIPYVHLKPGQWDLTCSSHAATSTDWQYTVQLQVLGSAETQGEGQSAEQGAEQSEEQNSVVPRPFGTKIDNAKDINDTGGVSQSEAAAFVNSDLPLVQAQAHLNKQLGRYPEDGPHSSSRSDLDAERQAIAQATTAYEISLKRRAFFAPNDQPMTIVGQVQALTDLAAGQLDAGQDENQLWLRLQNPDTAQVIMEAHRPINLDRLPADFKVKIQLPAHVTTQIVWGEVSLRSSSGARHALSGTVLGFAAFTITAGVSRFLDNITSQEGFETESFDREFNNLEGDLSAPLQGSTDYSHDIASEETLSLPAVTALSGSSNGSSQDVTPAVGVVLPPQLDYPAEVGTHSRLSLPSFPSANPSAKHEPEHESEHEPGHEHKPVQLPPMVTKPAQFMGTSIEDDDLETAEIAALLEDIDGDLEPIAPASESFGLSNNNGFSATVEPSDDLDDLSETPESTASALDNPYHRQKQKEENARAAFRSLRLKDHFMQRLSDLTHDEVNQANKFAEELQAAGVGSEGPQAFTQADVLANSEVVIFEEPPAVEELDPDVPSDVQHSVQSQPPRPLPSSSESPPNSLLGSPPSSLPSPPRSSPRSSPPSLPPSSLPISQPVSQPPQLSPSSQPLLQSAADLSATSVSEADRNRQLRLARLRQRQEARAARSAGQPVGQTAGQPIEQSVRQAEQRISSAQPSSVQPAVPAPAGALASYRSAESGFEELPEMVIPIISVPVGDLVAGDRVTITVRTRPSVFKPIIKLWMIDRQSRTVVEEPKLLSDLRPDALGDLQTSTELLVPMGCLDVQIAAIAIDIVTQQESNKAIVNRHVIPPMQSLPPLKNFKERNFKEREWQ